MEFILFLCKCTDIKGLYIALIPIYYQDALHIWNKYLGEILYLPTIDNTHVFNCICLLLTIRMSLIGTIYMWSMYIRFSCLQLKLFRSSHFETLLMFSIIFTRSQYSDITYAFNLTYIQVLISRHYLSFY
jgi:hypothetical protein